MTSQNYPPLNRIGSFREMRFYIAADAIMNGYDTVPLLHRLARIDHVRRFLVVLRITEWLYNTKHLSWRHRWKNIPYFFCRRKFQRLSYLCGFSIPLNTIGYGVHLAHHGTCVINSNCHVGPYCSFFNNVCIGDGTPKVIAQGVRFCTGAVVIKGASVARNVTIAANSLVNKPIEQENSTWGGLPARLLKNDTRPWYEQWPWQERHRRIEVMREKMMQ